MFPITNSSSHATISKPLWSERRNGRTRRSAEVDASASHTRKKARSRRLRENPKMNASVSFCARMTATHHAD